MSTGTQSQASQDIVRSLIKVRLMISEWDGRVYSGELARNIAQANDASKDSVDVKLIYLPKTYGRPITQAASRARLFWNAHSLPWEDKAWRVAPVQRYQALIDGTQPIINEFDSAVEYMCEHYEDVYNAAKEQLHSLFIDVNFPSKDQLRNKFGIRIFRDVIHTVEDIKWVPGLADHTVDEIRADISAQYSEQLKHAVLSIVARIRELVVDIVDRMKRVDDDVKLGTLLRKINNTCSSLTGLNITGDPQIESVIEKLRQLGKFDKDDIKKSVFTQQQVLQEAGDILTILDGYKG